MKRFSYSLLLSLFIACSGSTLSQTPKPAATPAADAAPQDICGCEAAPLPEILATVNGEKIARKNLNPYTQARVTELQQKIIEARSRELEFQINSFLLEAEAHKRGTSTMKLLREEVVGKTEEPTEAEALAFYTKHKDEIPGEFKDVKGDIILYLKSQSQAELAKKLADTLRAAASLKILSQTITPPANEAEKARVFAIVNGSNITSRNIEESLLPMIAKVQEQVYSLRRDDVETQINDILLTNEAKKQGVATQELLDAVTQAKVAPITDGAAQKFYDENKDKINRAFPEVKEEIVQYLAQREVDKLTASFAKRLRQGAAIQIFITPSEAPALKIATDNQPAKGNLSAKVTVIEFTDFQCPSCARQHPILERVMAEYGDRVKLVVRDYPLSQHENAMKAAEAAEAAREQGKYWEYAALLFSNQSALQPDKLKQYADRLGLDRAKFDSALDSGKFTESVERDKLDGDRLGVDSTPTLYVNGRLVADTSYEGLKAMIEAALKTSK